MFEEFHRQKQVANLSTHTPEPSRHFNYFCYDDDDDDNDEEKTIPLCDIISQLPPSIVITPSPSVLPIKDPKDSLVMRNEELSTILEMESDEVIKSSVEDLVPILSESKDTSGSDSECDLPSCNDFSPINIHEGKFVLEDIESKDFYDSNLDEPALLVTPLFDSNEDKCFDLGGDVDEINAFDIPLDFKYGYYDSEGDVLYLESFLSDDTTPNLPPEVFRDHYSRSLSDIIDLKIMVKVFDLGIPEKFFSPTYVIFPFKDHHYLFLTYVIRIFLPYFTYRVDSPFLLSSESEDTIFDPGIFAFHFLL
nr:hypothetical protein [Tanacetum cinerariifolium]